MNLSAWLAVFIGLQFLGGATETQIEYTTETNGPLTTFAGRVTFYKTAENPAPTFSHVFDIPVGEVIGSSCSSDPWVPMIGDWATWTNDWEGNLSVRWVCRHPSLNPITGEVMQQYPVWSPLEFRFHVQKNSFDGSDLADLLDNWGTSGVWDLNHDGIVDGGDVALLIGNWKGSE